MYEFALLTHNDYIYNLLPNAAASYGNRGDMASFDCPNDTASFVDLENMASSDGHNDAASYDDDDDNDTA